MNEYTLESSNQPFRRLTEILRRQTVWVVSALILLALTLFSPTQAYESASFLLSSLAGTAPFLILSILVAAIAAATGADSLIARAFTGSPVKMIVLAAVIGGVSPFCSCGVIPLIAALLSMGVPLAPVMAFWLASPVIDPAMFVLTSGLLGVEFAVAKTLAAIFLGFLGGFMIHALGHTGLLASPLRQTVGNSCGTGSLLNTKDVVWSFWNDVERLKKFKDVALNTTLFLFKWLSLAFLLVPVLTATLVGVPAYLNGYAALPLVSGLIEQGMAPGAGLAFLVAGGVTRRTSRSIQKLRPVFWYQETGHLFAARISQA